MDFDQDNRIRHQIRFFNHRKAGFPFVTGKMALNEPLALDYTLKDLYELDGPGYACPTWVYCVNTEDPSYGNKFVYHASLQSPPITKILLRLSVTSQRYGFVSGGIPVVILATDPNNSQPDALSKKQLQIQRSFSQLEKSQRPILRFATDPTSLPLTSGSPIAVIRPIDSLSCHPHIVEPQTHYEILSKRGLAYSNLPTPPSLVIDTQLSCDEILNRSKIVDEATRMIRHLDTYPIPYVVKLPQSAGSGTFVVSSEDSRAQVKELLALRLPEMLTKLGHENYSLNPCSLVLQRYIAGKVIAISLFVTPQGRSVFVAGCKQSMDSKGSWIGASISYLKQTRLTEQYLGIVDKAAEFLHHKGYYGPAGIDVVTDASENHFIIDLNVRNTGSFCLGLLKGHFTERGLYTAVLEKKYFPFSRDMFENKFVDEIRDGRMIITGWAYDDSARMGYGVVVIGGRDSKEAESLLERVREDAIKSK